MERVFEWRGLQEQKLAKKINRSSPPTAGLTIMSEADLRRFILHYERLTRHILNEMPGRADIVFFLDETHNAAKVRVGGVGS
jgi:D-glycerate 3-kinase